MRMRDVPNIFGSMVFNDAVMKARLPKEVYKALKKTMEKGTTLEMSTASAVAAAMKDWAVDKGVTHYTHWFQPMTGITAEKHDSFIEKDGVDGAIMNFSGKSLAMGEPDASSFPSGGLRCTFEARGYTLWDTTSYAFIKDNTLCIPTAFCSYSGEALDKKTPLLRSMQAVEKQALRILKHFGKDDVKRVIANAGAEQEYFLIDKDAFLKRPDLVNCGRTLFGAMPPKGQELDDHYFGSLKARVADFMNELDLELWKLGVYSKTKHNEAAPAQHELVTIFSAANIATDHNQIVMELMKTIASKHNLACLLHEKPFAGVNGSGKHNNWSLSTDTGLNLFEPGDTPHQNAQFLLFLAAVIKAVDEYQGVLRATCGSAGNDHRLGANEAPPAIISIFLGNELTAILEALEAGEKYAAEGACTMEIGVTTLPKLPKDTTDRNRTSPMAFTGNKFEFRMLGSAFSTAGPNIALNTALAEALRQFADVLDEADNTKKAVATLIKDTVKNHKRIIFNGDNYSDEWVDEAKSRGLDNFATTPEALPVLISQKSLDLFERHTVFSHPELASRYEILLETYHKTLQIEALTMIDMVKAQIIPAALQYQYTLSKLMNRKEALSEGVDASLEKYILTKVSNLCKDMLVNLQNLEKAKTKEAMDALRNTVDQLEAYVPRDIWPLPTYAQLFSSTN